MISPSLKSVLINSTSFSDETVRQKTEHALRIGLRTLGCCDPQITWNGIIEIDMAFDNMSEGAGLTIREEPGDPLPLLVEAYIKRPATRVDPPDADWITLGQFATLHGAINEFLKRYALHMFLEALEADDLERASSQTDEDAKVPAMEVADPVTVLKTLVAAWDAVGEDEQIPESLNVIELWDGARATVAKAEGHKHFKNFYGEIVVI
jgi:hypothetical protein